MTSWPLETIPDWMVPFDPAEAAPSGQPFHCDGSPDPDDDDRE